jgi:ribonuclease HII
MSKIICGIDEVGRGAWAGPMCVGVVLTHEDFAIEGLTDSKKLSPKRRQSLIPEIQKQSVYISVGSASPTEIDAYGLTKGLVLATERALSAVEDFGIDQIILDGTDNYLRNTKYTNLVTCIPKADLTEPSVSAASIVAKEFRDTMMACFTSPVYGDYSFGKHSGYVTKLHKEQVATHGISLIHRKLWKVS